MSAVDIRTRKPVAPAQPPTVNGRPPPNALDAEAALIANCLQRSDYSADASVIDRVVVLLGDLGPRAFYGELNQTIWGAIVELHAANVGVDSITVATRLRESGAWTEQLAKHLAEIEGVQPMLIDRHLIDHARIVARKARMRRVIATLQDWTARGYDNVPDEGAYMRELSAAIIESSRELGAVEDIDTAHEADELLRAELAERQVATEQGNTAGMPTGIPALDAITGGLFARGVHVISGPEKGRKSTIAAWIAVAVAASRERVVIDGALSEQHRGVVVFPLEMNRTELQLVASCQRGNVNSALFTKGGARPEDYAKRERGAAEFTHLPLLWDDRPGLSIATLKGRLREARAKLARGIPGRKRRRADGTMEILAPLAPAPLRLVVIDTIQLLGKQTPHRPGELQSVVDSAGAAIKEMAGKDPEFARVSWLWISHENAEGDLRDSGALKNHLTQWIKLSIEDNKSDGPFDHDEQIARFKVHRWRQGAAGDEAVAWLNRKTGALS